MTTAPRTFAKLAAKCVADCYKEGQQELVFRDTYSTTAVSALTSLVTAAQFAEDTVSQSSLMGKLQVCIFVKSITPDMKASQKVLWSSIEDLRGALHRSASDTLEEHPRRGTAPHNLLNAAFGVPPEALQCGAINSSNDVSRAHLPNAISDSQPVQNRAGNGSGTESQPKRVPTVCQSIPNGIPRGPAMQGRTRGGRDSGVLAIRRTHPESKVPFTIPRTIAGKVASNILEGCGYFRHNANRDLGWPQSYSELYCKHVTFLLQRIYEAEKQLLMMPNLRYENLIPDHLSSRPVKIDGLEDFFKKRKRGGTQDDMFLMDLKSRSNTQKHVAFAALCIAYEKKYGENVTEHAAKAVLETFRREGDSEIGCNRYRERGTNVKVHECSRKTYGSCLQGDSGNTEITMTMNHLSMVGNSPETSRPVACGTVDITVYRINEQTMSKSLVAVHVTHLNSATASDVVATPTENRYKQTETISDESTSTLTLNSMIVWEKKNISRVRVLYNFKSPVGTAILVSYLEICSESETGSVEGERGTYLLCRVIKPLILRGP